MDIIKTLKRHDFVTGKPSKYTIYKSPEYLGPGYVWAPYIPMIDFETSFQPRQSLVSRYATKMVNNNYYSTIICD